MQPKEESDVDLLVPLRLLGVVCERFAIGVCATAHEVAQQAPHARRICPPGLLATEPEHLMGEHDRQLSSGDVECTCLLIPCRLYGPCARIACDRDSFRIVH